MVLMVLQRPTTYSTSLGAPETIRCQYAWRSNSNDPHTSGSLGLLVADLLNDRVVIL